MTAHLRLDPAFDAVVDAHAPLERVLTGFAFTEGPVWRAREGDLIFSDIRGDSMYCATPDGHVSVFRRPSRNANGSTLDRQGRLITCAHATSRVVRAEPDGSLTVLASHWRGSELNSPNDVVVGLDGAVWFTDPTYGRMAEYGVARPEAQPCRGVYRIAPDGVLSLAADGFDQPNGLCLTSDGRALFISDTRRQHVRRFAVADDGALSGGEVFAETTGDEPGSPDGLKLDAAGNLWSCGPGGLHVFAPDARPLGIVRVPEEATNFTWTGPGLRKLVVTAQGSIYRLGVRTPGLPLNEE